MKKIFTILSVLGLSIASYAQVTVTYQVDINAYIAAGNTLNANGIRVGGNFTSNGSTKLHKKKSKKSKKKSNNLARNNFEDSEGLKQVETTIWATTDKRIILKGGVVIPIIRIHEVKII